MHKLYLVCILLLSVFVAGLISPTVYGVSENIVISQVQAGALTGAIDAAAQEFVSIYNNSDQDVDISNWCVVNKVLVSFACFTPSAVNETLHLPSHKYATISSESFAEQHNYVPDVKYSKVGSYGSIVAGSDNITLIDSNGSIIDGISWETSLTGGSLLQRQTDAIFADKLIETDAADDFKKITTLVVPDSGLEEWVVADVCLNMNGIQTIVPDGYTLYENGDCIDHDECPNLIGIQSDIPDGFIKSVDNNCKLNLLQLRLSELLPNAIGSDVGNEFIEIYNPNDVDVDLTNYVIYVGIDYESHYKFPTGSHIGPGQYIVFSNNDIKFTLVNTESSVRLSSIDDTIIDETSAYDSPKEGMAWALIDDTWQYTNRPTPGTMNMVSLIEPDIVAVVIEDNIEPCAANQYRSPETNRCRLIVIAETTLVACKDGQYRSEETNRCRSIAPDANVLAPCVEGEERNPDTNRCRAITASVLGSSDLVPCKEGQERNPETNRCRNVVSEIPQADYAPEQTAEPSTSYMSWLALAGVGTVAIGYGAWEWRREIMRLVHKIRFFRHRIK